MPRVILNNSYYFLTTPTFNHEKYFNTNKKKNIILKQLNNIKNKFKISIYAYSIAYDHYHLLFYLEDKNRLKDIIRVINGGSSFVLNKIDGINRRIWDNYWTKIILEERMFYNVWGYIIGNLLKYKEVQDFSELNKSPYSSFSQAVREHGLEFTVEIVKNVIKLDLEDSSKFKTGKS